jgi:hypothetical protein
MRSALQVAGVVVHLHKQVVAVALVVILLVGHLLTTLAQ